MKSNKFAKSFSKILDRLTGVKYDNHMVNIKTDPEEFEEIKDQYEVAVRARQDDIKYLYFKAKWKQQKIADFFNMDLAQVNRLIRKIEKEQEK